MNFFYLYTQEDGWTHKGRKFISRYAANLFFKKKEFPFAPALRLAEFIALI